MDSFLLISRKYLPRRRQRTDLGGAMQALEDVPAANGRGGLPGPANGLGGE